MWPAGCFVWLGILLLPLGSYLAKEGLIKRAWLGSGEGKERIYKINEYFFEELRKIQSQG